MKGNYDDRLQKLIEAAVEGRTRYQIILDSLEAEELQALDYSQRFSAVLGSWAERNAPAIAKKVQWTSLPQVFVAGPPGLEAWRVPHPKSYNRHAPLAEKRLWAKFVQPILGTHGHHVGLSVSPNGEHLVAQIGDTSRYEGTRYLHEHITDHPIWTSAFGAIIGGRLKLWVNNPYYHDWWELEHGKERKG